MSRLLRRSSLRHLSHHPWIVLLSLLGVMLGVAVVVSIDLTGRSAHASFERTTDVVAGRATHQIVGGPQGVPEGVYVDLRSRGLRASAPVIEGTIVVQGEEPRVMTLLGVDPLAEREFRAYSGAGLASRALLSDFLGGSPAVLLAEATAERLGVAIGDSLPITAGSRRSELRVAGFLSSSDPLQATGLESLLLVDVGVAQTALGIRGRLSRIDLRLIDTPEDRVRLAEVEAALPNGLRVQRSASRSETAQELTRAFRINLQALSLLALLCGAFLIYNSVTFSVVLRRKLFATLRALGTTRGRILRMVFAEAVLVGLVGSVGGVLLGVLLARGLVGMVSRTVTDFYFNAGAGELALDPVSLIGGVLLGTAAAGAAGLRPAWEATTISPRLALLRSSLETGTRRSMRYVAVAALGAIAFGALVLTIGDSIAISFVGVFAVLLGCTLTTPLAAIALTSRLSRWFGSGLGMTGRMAIRSVGANLSRTGVAMAALMMALAVAVSIGLMISSFRNTVERWLQASLPADLYVTSAAAGSQDAVPPSVIDDAWLAAISELPSIERVNALRRVQVQSSVGEVIVVALDIDERSHGAFILKQAVGDGTWDDYHSGKAVLASEPLAFRTGLEAGSEIGFPGAGDGERLPVGGVFYDYSTDRGYLLMSLELYRQLWTDDGLTAASMFVADDLDLDAAAEQVREVLPPEAGLIVRSDAVLRSESLRVFDRTFRITGVLRGLAILVAMIGILGSLMALQLERTRELGLLRAAGLTGGQLWRLVTMQTGIMGLISGVLALPVGIAMAAMMIYVVNRRSFGWTMPLEIDPAILLQTVALAVVAAVLAGVIPSRRMASVSPSEALREE